MSSKIVRELSPKSVWDEESLLNAFTEHGIKHKHYVKVMAKLYNDFTEGKVTHLSQFEVPIDVTPKVHKIFSSGEFALMTSKVIRREDSSDNSTTKILIELQDGKQVETVLMRYNNTVTGGHKRTTLCVSSQVGCAMACSFCATGTMGLSGNLCSGEILEQFIWANQVDQIRNVVFMGMGEPLHNYDAVLSAITAMTHNSRFALKQTRVTLSTVGIVPRMFQIMEQAPFVTLALSLHAPTQAMRERIVPSARQYKLTDLMDAIDYYYETTKKQMLLEYVMLDDVNSSEETAHLLGKLLYKRQVMLNLIPFNPVLTKAQHRAPTPETVEKFASIVANEYGVFVTARKEFGQDISGACGQLAVKTLKANRVKSGVVETLERTAYEGTDGEGDAADQKQQVIAPTLDTTTSSRGETADDNNNNDDDNDDDADLVGNGLEGLMSAMGELGGKIEATGCGDDAGDAAEMVDLEDLVSDGAAKTKTQAVARKEKEKCGDACDCEESKQTDLAADLSPSQTSTAADTTATTATTNGEESTSCPPGCACHTREALIKAATAGVDPDDTIAYSRAVLSIGPILANGPRKPRVGVTRKELAEKADAEMNSRAEDAIVPTAAPSLLGGSVSTLVIPPREKDLRPRVFVPKKGFSLEGIDEPIMVTMDDEYGRSELPNGGKTAAHDELLPTSVALKAKTKELKAEPKATVEDSDELDDMPVRKINDAEELLMDGENRNLGRDHTALARQALMEKKKQSSCNMALVGAGVAVLACVAGLVIRQLL